MRNSKTPATVTTPRQLIGCAAFASGGLTNLTANVCPSDRGSILLLDAPGLLCLERYIDGRDGGAKTQLIEEVVDGVKAGNWICPDGGGCLFCRSDTEVGPRKEWSG
jgi:hypothetical protein